MYPRAIAAVEVIFLLNSCHASAEDDPKNAFLQLIDRIKEYNLYNHKDTQPPFNCDIRWPR